MTVLVRRWIAADEVPAGWVADLAAAEPDPAQAIRQLCCLVRRVLLERMVEPGEEEVVAAVVLASLELPSRDLARAVEDVIVGLGGPPSLAPARVVQDDSNLLLAALVVALVALASPLGTPALARLGLA